MPVPSKTPDRPGTITAAQVLVSTQAVSLFCCGFAPIFAFVPAYLVPVLGFAGSGLFWVALLLIEVAAIAYAVVTVRRLGDGDWRGQVAVTAGLVVITGLTVAGTLSWASDGVSMWWALTTAAPSLLPQIVAWACVHSRSAARWFSECAANEYRAEPEA